MLKEYISALLFIFAAEMGDKTQILAMMFATKYKVNKVLIGIFIGAFLNHGIAVLFGSALGNFIDTSILQMIAGVAFIGFAFWTMLSKDEDEEEEIKSSKSAIVTVAMAFFIGELGDKTQLTAITLSVDAIYPFIVLLGTVSGMLVTSGIGIFVGSKIGDKIPELWIKIFSSSIFLVFGVLKLIEGTPDNLVNIYTIIILVVVLVIGLSYLGRMTFKGYRSGELTPYRRAAKLLYEYRHANLLLLEDLCRTTTHCGNCKHESCGIGLIRHILEDIGEESLENHHEAMIHSILSEKDKFERDKLLHMLEANVQFLNTYKIQDKKRIEIDNIRKITEILLFGTWVEYKDNIKTYIDQIKQIDEMVAMELEQLNR